MVVIHVDSTAGSLIEVDDDPGKDFTSISEAVNEAENGDTILVYNGTYEENVVLDKELTLEGTYKDGVHLDGLTQEGVGIDVKSDNCTVSGMTLKNFDTGIEISGTDDTDISNCVLEGGDRGIYIVDSRNVELSNNSLSNTTSFSIRCLNSTSLDLKRNQITGSGYYPVYLSRTRDVEVTDSIMTDNTNGLYIYKSVNTHIEGNHISSGLNLDGDTPIHWTSHAFINNTCGSGEIITITNRSGVFLQDKSGQLILLNVTDSVVSLSEMSGAEVGLLLAHSNQNRIIGNTLVNNTQGIKFHRSNENEIHHNNLIDNIKPVYSPDNSSYDNTWSDGLGDGNYWCDYDGKDNGSSGRYSGDGVGDTLLPYPDIDHGAGFYRLDPDPLMNQTLEKEYDIALGLTSGWEFISPGLVVINRSVEEFLAPISGNYDKVMHYCGCKGEWKTFVPSRPEKYDDLHKLNRTMGFWVHMTSPDNLTVKGCAPARTKIPLHDGWNMIGISSNLTVNGTIIPNQIDRIALRNSSREYDLQYIYDQNATLNSGSGYLFYQSSSQSILWNQVYKGQ